MRKLTLIVIIICMLMFGCSAVFIKLIYRTEVLIENKTDTKPVINDNKENSKETVDPLKKMKQSDFDRIMANISKEQDSISTSDKTKHMLPVFDSNWMPWEEYKNASPEARKAMSDEFKEPGSIEAKVEQLIKEYDENFDLEAVIDQSPYLQHLRHIQEQKDQQAALRMVERESLLAAIQERRTFILNEAENRGAILIYDNFGNPIDYEKDEHGNPILVDATVDTPISNTDDIPQQDSIEVASQQISNTNLKSKVLGLWVSASKEYPEAVFAPMLAQEEFDAFYPTEESRQSLKKRKKQMQDYIVSQMQSILSSKNFSSQKDVLPMVQTALSENFDKDFADAVIKQLQHPRDE